MLCPEMNKLKNKYQFSYEFDNTSMNKVVSITKMVCGYICKPLFMISVSIQKVIYPLSEVAKDLLNFYKWGGKQIYYANSKDYKSDKLEDMIVSRKVISKNDRQ